MKDSEVKILLIIAIALVAIGLHGAAHSYELKIPVESQQDLEIDPCVEDCNVDKFLECVKIVRHNTNLNSRQTVQVCSQVVCGKELK